MKAVIFDLDGVIVSTDYYHYLAWKEISEAEGIPFDEEVNKRLRGVSRQESLDIILSSSSKHYEEAEKVALTTRKNDIYKKHLHNLSAQDILPGVTSLIDDLKQRGIKLAIGSSSRNTVAILSKIGLDQAFDAVVTGNDIQQSKPHPEVFLLAAERLGEKPEDCVVIEDADAGVQAGLSAGMKVVGVGGHLQPDWNITRVADLTENIMVG